MKTVLHFELSWTTKRNKNCQQTFKNESITFLCRFFRQRTQMDQASENIQNKIIVPTHFVEGSEQTAIYSSGFFVQSVLADRYIHRRELRLVSLEGLSSAEYGIKKIILIFVFHRVLSRFKFWENRVNSGEILITFSEIFDQNFANFASFVSLLAKNC